MQCMEQIPTGDELYINLLINKTKLVSKLAQNNNVSNTTPFSSENCDVVKGQCNIVGEKEYYDNQILLLTKRVEKLEREVSSMSSVKNNNIAKHKKE